LDRVAARESAAEQAVLELLGMESMNAASFLDLVEQRPVLLDDEAEGVLDELITIAGARARDDPSLAAEHLELERIRRALRDCRLRGVEAVRGDLGKLSVHDPRLVLKEFGLSDTSQLSSDPAMIDWREGTILLRLGRVDEGVAYLRRAAAVAHEKGRHGFAARVEILLWNIVRGVRGEGDLEAALVHAENAAVAYRKAGDEAGLRQALEVLAIDSDCVASGDGRSEHYLCLLSEVDADVATWLRSYIRGTRLMWSDPDSGRAALRWCMDSVGLMRADKDGQAHWRNECARKLAFIDAKVRPDAPEDTAQDHFLAALLALQHDEEEAAVIHVRRAVVLAEDLHRSVVTEVSQRTLSGSLSPIYHLAASMADRAGHPTEPLDLGERNTSRSLLARLAMHQRWSTAGPDVLVVPGHFKRRVVHYQTAVERGGGAGERRQLLTALYRLREVLAEAERGILATTSGSRQAVAPVSAMQLAGHLGADDVVVVYTTTGVVYAVTRTGVSRVADFDAKVVDDLCAGYRRLAAIPGHDAEDLARWADKLDAACVAPVREAVDGHQRVLVIPNESLWGVPLGVVGSRPLDADHLVAYVPSLSILNVLMTRPHQARRVERFVGVGNPDGSLPYAAAELADAASRFYDRAVHTGAEIELDAVRADLPHADVIHIACHGFAFDGFPDLSALHIAGAGRDRDLLWVPDLVRLDLRARLVVLAACHAGLSHALPGNEYAGLPGVFLVSGARTVLGPLWQVDDQVTAQFMAHFHRALAEASPAGALRRAQQAIKAEPSTAHPYYWAAFQLFGLP